MTGWLSVTVLEVYSLALWRVNWWVNVVVNSRDPNSRPRGTLQNTTLDLVLTVNETINGRQLLPDRRSLLQLQDMSASVHHREMTATCHQQPPPHQHVWMYNSSSTQVIKMHPSRSVTVYRIVGLWVSYPL